METYHLDLKGLEMGLVVFIQLLDLAAIFNQNLLMNTSFTFLIGFWICCVRSVKFLMIFAAIIRL
jgi:hypothetical protein